MVGTPKTMSLFESPTLERNSGSHPSGSGVFRGGVRILAAEVLLLPTGLITAIFLARSLGAADYGLFVLVSQIIVWFELVINKGLADTSVKLIAGSKNWRPYSNSLISVGAVLGLMCAGLLAVSGYMLAKLFGEPKLYGYIGLYALEIPILAVAFGIQHTFIGLGRYSQRALISAVRWIFRLLLIVGFVSLGGAVLGAIGASVLASAVAMGVGVFWLRPKPVKILAFPVKTLVQFLVPLGTCYIMLRLFRMELFVIKALGASSTDAGLYGAAMNLSIVPALVAGAFVAPYLNTVVRYHKTAAYQSIVHLTTDMIRWWLWVVPLITVAVASAPEMIGLIYGCDFLASAPIFGVLLLAAYAQVFVTFSIAILVALDRPRWTIRVVAPVTILGLVAQCFMIPRFGLIGAALVVLTGTVVAALLFFMLLGRLQVLVFPWRSLFNAGVVSVVVTLSACWWPATGVLVVVKLIALSVMMFALFAILGERLADQVKTMCVWISRVLNMHG